MLFRSGVNAIEGGERQNLLGALGAVAKHDHPVLIVALDVLGPLEADESREHSRLVVALGGLDAPVPRRARQLGHDGRSEAGLPGRHLTH